MKSKMEDIDKLIKETLTQEEARFYDDLEEQNYFQMAGGLFRGKHSWLMILTNVIQLALTVLGVYFIVILFQTEDSNEIIRSGIGGILCAIGVSLLKSISIMHMLKNDLAREVKRVELQISSLSAKLLE